jgi:murein DD-endopeptidase
MPIRHIRQLRDRVPTMHQRLMLLCLLSISVLMVWPQQKQQQNLGVVPLVLGLGLQHGPAQLQQFPVTEITEWLYSKTQTTPPEDPYVKVYNIESGDSLSRIFARYGLNYQTVQQVMAADESLLALDVLRPGNRLMLQHSEPGSKLQ